MNNPNVILSLYLRRISTVPMIAKACHLGTSLEGQLTIHPMDHQWSQHQGCLILISDYPLLMLINNLNKIILDKNDIRFMIVI